MLFFTITDHDVFFTNISVFFLSLLVNIQTIFIKSTTKEHMYFRLMYKFNWISL